MAKRIKKRLSRLRYRSRPRFFRRKKTPLPLLPILGGVVAPMADAFQKVGGMQTLQQNPTEFGIGMVDQICQKYTGFAPFAEHFGHTEKFNIMWMAPTYAGLAAGIIGHKLATKFGINRSLTKFQKYVEL